MMDSVWPKSYKGRFPFRLGTTSYIYPMGYVANIERLGPWLDEIELLFFESRPDVWPSAAELVEMVELAGRFALDYHVHLPLDLELGHAAAPIRRAAVDTVLRLFERTTPLSPTTWTLHLTLDADPADPEAVAGWRQRILDSLAQLHASGIPPRAVSLENLDYPIEWIGDLSRQTGFRMCLDVGHLLLNRVDVPVTYNRFRDLIDVIHLHGVRNGKDHLSLAAYGPQDCHWIGEMLKSFTGSLSLEVFSHEALVTSLDFFEKMWNKTH
jgi:sugar phosphate isomerase/epimerase